MVVLCDVQLRLFSDEVSYRVTLAAVGVIALGCTGQSIVQTRSSAETLWVRRPPPQKSLQNDFFCAVDIDPAKCKSIHGAS